jgi:hypothetical protein
MVPQAGLEPTLCCQNWILKSLVFIRDGVVCRVDRCLTRILNVTRPSRFSRGKKKLV